MATPNFFVKTNNPPLGKLDAVNVAARFFVYKLYEATDRRRMAWHSLRGMGEAPATVARAVEKGWAIVQLTNSGRVKEQHGCLTDEGRAVARKGSPVKVYPNYEAPVIRSTVTPNGIRRSMTMMRWGFAAPPFYKVKANVTNVRNVASAYWTKYFRPAQRCIVPATAFSEPDRNTSKPVIFRWFERPDRRPFFFAGIWREWEGDRGTKKAPNVGRHLLFSFLTTAPNGVVEPIHAKAMPVLLLSAADVEQWLEAPAEEAMLLQRPASEGAIVLRD
jgi:putative SOS response-associated peptidase YedK